ncbi:YlbF family regulator [Anaerofustis stercorihominis]|uniref:YlbF family regulator n=1 Tax=Anaerofustis stercorihominis TaxID=214853 RepID=UPI00214BD2F9|nr:YlbF family regulator [Anaerofustis stercorihominis]MCR2033588.1 YlbF family regulator [Anaerofustis stercorihominis]
MNVYDKANDLAKAIKESDEFKRYKDAAVKVDQNEEHKKMIKNFMDFQYEFYLAQMKGEQPDEKRVEEFNILYSTISNISDIKEFMEAQMFFARVMEDIQKTVAEASDTGLAFLNELVGK